MFHFLRHKRVANLKKKIKNLFTHLGIIGISLGLVVAGVVVLWFTTLKIPDLDSFDERVLGQSTKIFDKTGKVLLYDFGQNMRRTVVPLEDISPFAKNATIAIEDAEFYNHHGIKITSIIRAALVNFTTGEYTQGGSTITQQVIKNSLLTKEKTIARKIKEIFLAIKLERILTKDEILHLYLNETPYGGTVYGIEEASMVFFGKKAKDLTLAESAYLAALPQAPTYYSPFGKHKDELEKRKNLVLEKMLENDFINQNEYRLSLEEKVTFVSSAEGGIKAPHFVMFVRQHLEEQFGEQILAEGGLRVTTTLDYELQKKAEEIVKQYALENAKKYNAKNASLVALDAKTGQIIVMVGSRDYFDKEIEGNYNIATAKRQPGSSFKPFIYVKAFEKGYLPETVLFDLKTQFSTNCEPTDLTEKEGCYSPQNYDDKFRGPISLRNALAQSINVPAVKLFYLVGMKDTLELVKKLGISTIKDPSQYGLSLVLGGGEVTLVDMVTAYGVLSQNGEKYKTTPILKIENNKGKVIEEWKEESETVLPKQPVLLLTDVLTDNEARSPSFGVNSPLYFKDRDVAAKTGTTNDYRDTWIVGYTPQIAVGAWAGNNDNSSIDKKVAGYVVAPMWRAFMDEALKTLPDEKFEKPEPIEKDSLPPILQGVWKGDATGPHSILHWIDKENPTKTGNPNPWKDPQYTYWEYPIRLWATGQNLQNIDITINTPAKTFTLSSPTPFGSFSALEGIVGSVKFNPEYINIKKVNYFLNGLPVGTSASFPFSITIYPTQLKDLKEGVHTLKAIGVDEKKSEYEASVDFTLKK